MNKKNIGIKIIALIFIGAILIITGCSDNQKQEISIKPPQQEIYFAKIVEKAIDESKSTENEVKRTKAKEVRAKELCGLLKSKRIKNWYGIVSDDIATTYDNKGTLSVYLVSELNLVYRNKSLDLEHISANFNKKILIQTWNNTFSDFDYHTLIHPNTKIYSVLSELQQGDLIRFSGTFFPDNKNCIHESSLTLKGGLEEPEFIFKFSDIKIIKINTALMKSSDIDVKDVLSFASKKHNEKSSK